MWIFSRDVLVVDSCYLVCAMYDSTENSTPSISVTLNGKTHAGETKYLKLLTWLILCIGNAYFVKIALNLKTILLCHCLTRPGLLSCIDVLCGEP